MRILYVIMGLVMGLVMGAMNLVANNIDVSNVVLTRRNTSAGVNNAANHTFVQFNITWENSWRTSYTGNWDAAWIFVKYRVRPSGTWQHAWLHNTGHSSGSIGAGGTIANGLQTPGTAFNATTNPVLGVFLHRASGGAGTFTSNAVELRWNYGANALNDNDSVDVKVFAIEMVYVPQGAFYVGDGETVTIDGQFEAGTTGSPLQITSEGALTLGGGGAGSLGNNNAAGMVTPVDDFNDGTTRSLPAAFPKGYNAFYCMKYEITQGQYRDFLNTLTYSQQNTRTATTPNSAAGTAALAATNRNGLEIATPGVASSTPAVYGCDLGGNGAYDESDDGEWIGNNFTGWMDGCAYADWAGLRPMTELEFEKACRGPETPVTGEYAWGTTSITAATSASSNQTSGEIPSNTGANCVYGEQAGFQSPIRVGAFATASSTREQAGATYWGMMEMSGNLAERVVTVGNATGRAFEGTHGDGALSANGNANTATWPGITSGEVTTATGSGFRGGGWIGEAVVIRVSDRTRAAFVNNNRSRAHGFRGVRTAE